MATSHGKLWKKKSFQIDPGETKVVDSALFSTFNHSDYILNIFNIVNTKSKSINISVKKDDTEVVESVSSKLGLLDVAVTPLANGPNYELQLTNNEAFAIQGNFAKAQI